jgi:hypothetical protein
MRNLLNPLKGEKPLKLLGVIEYHSYIYAETVFNNRDRKSASP